MKRPEDASSKRLVSPPFRRHRISAVNGDRTDEDWTYTYDALDRLLGAANTNTPALSQSFTYDLGGNLTSNSAIGTYAYPSQGSSAVRPHAVSTAGSWTFSYDDIACPGEGRG